MKNKLVLVVALLIAGFAFFMNWRYLRSEIKRLGLQAEKVEVIVPTRDLPAMTVLTYEDLALRSEFKSAVGNDAFFAKDKDSVIGKRLLYPVRRADILKWSQVDMPRRVKRGLSHIIEKGKRAISLSISGSSAVSGLIQPHDKVDILGTFTTPSRTNPAQVESLTLTLMQNVTVVATGSQIAGQESKRQTGYGAITFEVTPREAEVLVCAQQTRGQLYLSLRNPEDVSHEEELPPVNLDFILLTLQELNEKRQHSIDTTLP